MPSDAASTERIDYLQRSGAAPQIATASSTSGAPSSRRLLEITGIGRPDKDDARRHDFADPARRWRPPTAELITGLYGYRFPLAFEVVGGPEGVRVHLGTWSTRTAAGDALDRRITVVGSVLRGLYPFVEAGAVPAPMQTWPLSGIALGVPAPAGLDRTDGAAPLDRVIRSLGGAAWSLLVLAYPASEAAIGDVRSSILNEMRAVGAAAEHERAPSPLTEQYIELLKAGLVSAGEGMATGAWRTAVYLRGDGESYPGLASAWRSVMSGERSLPEPVRVFDEPRAAGWAQEWSLPDEWGAPGPGFYRRPFEAQTLLSTPELASMLHLPELEAPGFSVDLVPRFDVVARKASSNGTGLQIGRVLQNRQATGGSYEISRQSLTRHVFVAGITGSGKTNTIMSLLEETTAAGVPFLVIEPTKAEYRSLITNPRWGERVRVFTAGKATVAPFTLNPFEVPPGTTVSEHLDLLRAAFTAAFGMWTPLPQILERCLHEVYKDRGWDLRTNENFRLAGADTADAYPTLSDVVAKVEEVVPALGYEDKIAGDMRAALVTRLESLRQGGKGAMLDVARSLPDEELFGRPTVVELEPLGDEGDKALVTGLLLIRLAEHRRAQGQSPDLVHVLVVEEAHRLLGNVATGGSEEMANPRGQAVETFSNLLSEIRAYGQGVVIADQVPVRLAPDVMKNTNVKIAHRIVSADDRAALAGAMSMDERQSRALTSLGVGEAAVFSGGDDAPLLVQIPLAKDPLSPVPPSDQQVRDHAERWRAEGGFDELFLARPFCAHTCATDEACATARMLAADESVQRALSRLVVSTIDEPSAFGRLWEDLVAVIRPRCPPALDETDLLRAFAGHGADWLAGRRGAQGSWSYADTEALRSTLCAVLLDEVDHSGAASQALIRAFREQALTLHSRRYDPYPACDVVCTQDPARCMYRSAVADLVASRRYESAWYEADDADGRDEERRRRETWEVCQDAAYELIEFPEDDHPDEARAALDVGARRVATCFGQQMLAADRRKVPRTSRRILVRVLREAGL
jgi:Helicase HerA, central domain